MDLKLVGRAVRALRRRRRWRQDDLARAAGVSRSVVGRIERGESAAIAIGVVERVVLAVGGSLDLRVSWQGEGLDRLLDDAHARIVDWLVTRLRSLGWEVSVEVSFSRYGERGSIDVLAWHPKRHALAVFEVKSITPDMQAMLGGIDRKGRLAPAIARDRGWAPVSSVAKILALPDTSTNRRRLARCRATVQAALPAGTLEIRHWLEDPVGPAPAGVWFMADDRAAAANATNAKRIRMRAETTRTAAPPESPT